MSELQNYHFESAAEFAVVREFIRTTVDLVRTPEAIRAAARAVDGKQNFSDEQKRYAKDFLEAAAQLIQEQP
jgi:hypothetical protein